MIGRWASGRCAVAGFRRAAARRSKNIRRATSRSSFPSRPVAASTLIGRAIAASLGRAARSDGGGDQPRRRCRYPRLRCARGRRAGRSHAGLRSVDADRERALSRERRALQRRVRSITSVRCSRTCSRSRSARTRSSRPRRSCLPPAGDKGLTFGHAGLGSIPHLSVENLAEALKVKVQHLPFRGDGAMLPVLIKGDLDFGGACAFPRSAATTRSDRWWCFPTSAIRPIRMCRPPKELGVTTAVPPGQNGLYRAEGPAGGREGGARAWLRECGEIAKAC